MALNSVDAFNARQPVSISRFNSDQHTFGGNEALWTANRPGGELAYRGEIFRPAACLENVLPVDFKCDGYSAYEAFARQRAGTITLADCWSHARRKLFEAKESAPRTTAWFLRQIQHLYWIEKRLREQPDSSILRAVIR